ncbi:MAG TPA: tetratricopeptide repeat protein, partial [Planctomycetota bacterium]|nr:tetratricopeptide repeat protein [Planctomycetota bacterium]
RLFSPVLTSVRLSCLTMARHYTREGRPLAAILHLHLATQEGGYQMGIREDWRLGAELFRRQGALDLAEQTYGQMLMIDPCDVTALRGLADVLADKGYLRAALVCLEGACDIDPNDPPTRDALDALRRRFDDPEHHDRSLDLSAPDPHWLRYAMNAEQERPVYDDVIRLADEIPDDPIVQLSAAVFLGKSARDMDARSTREIAEKDRRLEDALTRVDRVVARLSRYTYAWARKCWLLAAAGKRDLAWDTLRRAQGLQLGDALTWHRLGLTLLGEDHVDLAIEAFRTATIASPGFYESHNNIGLLLVRRQTRPETPDEREQRYREAAKHFEKALSLPESRRAGAHNGLGFALLNLGRVDEAIPQFKRAIALDAKRATAYYFLAQACESQSDYFECVRVLSMGLKGVPKSPLLRTYLSMMLSSAPEPGVLDGKRALELARSVVAETEQPTARMYDLLAAAYAQDGQFAKAISTADEAIRAARAEKDENFAQGVRERQRLYRAGIPFRLSRGAPMP